MGCPNLILRNGCASQSACKIPGSWTPHAQETSGPVPAHRSCRPRMLSFLQVPYWGSHHSIPIIHMHGASLALMGFYWNYGFVFIGMSLGVTFVFPTGQDAILVFPPCYMLAPECLACCSRMKPLSPGGGQGGLTVHAWGRSWGTRPYVPGCPLPEGCVCACV